MPPPPESEESGGGQAGRARGGGTGGGSGAGGAGRGADGPVATPVVDAAPPAPDVAGSDQALAPDAPESDAASAGQPCKFALCEGFEAYADGEVPDPTLWAQKATKAVVDGAHPNRGKKALHVGPLTKDSIFIRETRTFPALGKAFYARVFLWVDREPIETPATIYHWTMIEAADTPEGTGRKVRLGGHIEKSPPGDWLRFNYETSAPTTPHETGLSDKKAIVAPKRWHCIEIYFDMNRQEARTWLNGEERTALHWLDSMPKMPLFKFPAEIKALSFGWTEYQPPTTPFDVWLDDIAVDGQRIGCDD